MPVLIIVWLVCAGLGWYIGRGKGREVTGLVLGLLLGLIGLVITACLPETRESRVKREMFAGGRSDAYVLESGIPPRTTPPVGWYPDPSGRHPTRYWNGTAWTEWVRDRDGAGGASDPQPWTAKWH